MSSSVVTLEGKRQLKTERKGAESQKVPARGKTQEGGTSGLLSHLVQTLTLFFVSLISRFPDLGVHPQSWKETKKSG